MDIEIFQQKFWLFQTNRRLKVDFCPLLWRAGASGDQTNTNSKIKL